MAGGGGGGGSYSGGGGGAGSAGSGGGFGAGSSSADACACALEFHATINGPDSDYLSALTLGSVLGVQLGGPQGRTIQVLAAGNYVLGSLIGIAVAAQLIECIAQGHRYQAQVVSILSGTVQVLVTRINGA